VAATSSRSLHSRSLKMGSSQTKTPPRTKLDKAFHAAQNPTLTHLISLIKWRSSASRQNINATDSRQAPLDDVNEFMETLCIRCSILVRYASNMVGHGYFPGRSLLEVANGGGCRLCRFLKTLGSTGYDVIYTQDIWDAGRSMARPLESHLHRSSARIFRSELAKERSFAISYMNSPNRNIAPQRISATTIDYELVKYWIRTCHENHDGQCSTLQHKTVPGLKVIDCKTREIIYPNPNYRYVALSYVWGSQDSLVPTSDAWPLTITDSATVTLRLGYRYLWVDRYVSTNMLQR
jgi:hypothetical protein